MNGKGAIKHLEQPLSDPSTAKTYKHLMDGGYHCMGRADTCFHIGRAFGEALLLLISKAPLVQKN